MFCRRIVLRWTEEVRVCPKTGLEGPLDDAYNWRKYGQKDILGAKHPRGYYRCTYRNAQDCLAMKQVQRSDEDPTMFHVTYRGRHTCFQASDDVVHGQSPADIQNQYQNKQKKSQDVFINFQTGSEAKRVDLHTNESSSVPSFISFPSTSPISYLEKQDHVFNSPLTPNKHVMGSFASPSICPSTTSQSNYLFPYGMNSFGAQDLQFSDYDLSEVVSVTTSTTNSPILDLDFDFSMYFDSHFPFGVPVGFFS